MERVIWDQRLDRVPLLSKRKKELEHLSDIATTQPQAAYTAFTHGIKSKWIYLARTTPNIDHLLAPLEEVTVYDASSYPPSQGKAYLTTTFAI